MVWPSFQQPTPFRLNVVNDGFKSWTSDAPTMSVLTKPHDSHPGLGHLILLVFEAVLEVVAVALPGYIVARSGQFDADKQKFLANLNVSIFTPCLIFIKLGSQLQAEKLVELAIIPAIFVVFTAVSYFVSIVVAKAFRFKKRPANFVTAMGVFGNSNSLPISLVISLSKTLKGLHWDRVPGDNDDEVAARGILYLLIFQQLGQLVRWSWGYHVLLAPKSKYEEYENERIEEGTYEDDPDLHQPLIAGLDGDTVNCNSQTHESFHDSSDESDVYEPAGRTPVAGTSSTTPVDSEDETFLPRKQAAKKADAGVGGLNGNFPIPIEDGDDILSFPRMRDVDEPEAEGPGGLKGYAARAKATITKAGASVQQSVAARSHKIYQSLPHPVRVVLAALWRGWLRVYNFLWEFMNPPLWAMLIAIVVSSVPELQSLFFKNGTFIKNSVTSAIKQSSDVAVPLILVVLGANLARNTQRQDTKDPEEGQIGTRLLVAALVSRMLLPTLICAPLLAVFAKYAPISILDDPIFIIVCFLLTGAPSALQLAQICQINEVYEGVMSKILFQSYVIWILPSTLILVMMALEVVEWAR